MKELRQFIGSLFFLGFIAGKVAGPLAAWSWWWLLLSPVPVIAWIVGVQ